MPRFDDEDIRLTANGVTTVHADASTGNITLGARGIDGDLVLKDTSDRTTVHLNGQKGQLILGTNGHDGNLVVRDNSGQTTAFINGDAGSLRLGRSGQDGDLHILDAEGNASIRMNGARAQLFMGTTGQDGNLIIRNRNNETTIFLDGDTGDIQLSNGDCAEEFDVLSVEGIEPGTVLVLNQDELLESTTTSYDTRVIGVVSGAGSYRPGLVLDRRDTGRPRRPVALMGKVYCKVDADPAPIQTGDLLTTSERAGYAMKAVDRERAFGAVIGKSLGSLDSGCGFIPILVALN